LSKSASLKPVARSIARSGCATMPFTVTIRPSQVVFIHLASVRFFLRRRYLSGRSKG
jgi:hypothetical protein